MTRNNTVSISSCSSTISVGGENYMAEIDRKANIMNIRNRDGKYYTSFPLNAAFHSLGTNDQWVYKHSFKLEKNHLEVLLQSEHSCWKEKKAIIEFYPEGIQIVFGCLAEEDKDLPIERVIYFIDRKKAMDDTHWNTRFTSDTRNAKYGPDQHYIKYPLVNSRLDDTWIFTPAPLNLSFSTPAGWMSVGCCQIPNSNCFRLSSSKGILVEEPENHIIAYRSNYYWSVPVVFTFNTSEWQGIRDYYNYLITHRYIEDIPITNKSMPRWWMRPTVCTFGEQLITFGDNPRQSASSDWVKDFVLKLEKRLGYSDFTVIVDEKWQKYYGDPTPSKRFADLKELIEWCHNRGHRVILWWMAWKADQGSLAHTMNLVDKDIVDATSPNFKEYIARCVNILLGNKRGQLNADGLKVDFLFLVRDGSYAKYQNSALGIGLRELHRYLKILYEQAKQVKSESLISCGSCDPHFIDCFDMVRLNDLSGSWKFVREERARIASLACPNTLIDGDGLFMFKEIADYHYLVSAAYSVPSLYYESRFQDGMAISDEMMQLSGRIFRIAAQKRVGKLNFLNHGHWQIERDGNILAECFDHGSILVVYLNATTALAISTKSQPLTIPLHGKKLKDLLTSGAERPDYAVKGDTLVMYEGTRGIEYQLHFS